MLGTARCLPLLHSSGSHVQCATHARTHTHPHTQTSSFDLSETLLSGTLPHTELDYVSLRWCLSLFSQLQRLQISCLKANTTVLFLSLLFPANARDTTRFPTHQPLLPIRPHQDGRQDQHRLGFDSPLWGIRQCCG